MKTIEHGAAATVQVAPADTPVLNDLGNGLAVTYVVDHPAVLEYVLQRSLDAAGWTQEELHHRGLHNRRLITLPA